MSQIRSGSRTGVIRSGSRTDATGPVSGFFLTLLLLLSVSACGGDDPAPQAAPDAATLPDLSELSGQAAFTAAEELLTSDLPVALNFDVEASGAVGAEITGSLLLGEDNRARLEATGTFAGQPLDVVLISDGERMFWTGGPDTGIPTPPALREALGIGFMRMGILHNLARLSAASPPDHAEGGAPEWVLVTPTEDRTVMGDVETGDDSLWDITVAGQPSGSFAMTFAQGEPSVRRQRVAFPQGTMLVVERYPAFTFGASAPAGAFDTTPLDPSR